MPFRVTGVSCPSTTHAKLCVVLDAHPIVSGRLSSLQTPSRRCLALNSCPQIRKAHGNVFPYDSDSGDSDDASADIVPSKRDEESGPGTVVEYQGRGDCAGTVGRYAFAPQPRALPHVPPFVVSSMECTRTLGLSLQSRGVSAAVAAATRG